MATTSPAPDIVRWIDAKERQPEPEHGRHYFVLLGDFQASPRMAVITYISRRKQTCNRNSPCFHSQLERVVNPGVKMAGLELFYLNEGWYVTAPYSPGQLVRHIPTEEFSWRITRWLEQIWER